MRGKFTTHPRQFHINIPAFVCLILVTSAYAALSACAASPSNHSYPLDPEGFIRHWLIAGPYPNPPADPEPRGFSDDLLKHLGGEANIVPYAGLTDKAVFVADKAKLIAGAGATNAWGFTTTKTFTVTWTPLHWEQEDPIISLDKRYEQVNDWIATFAACWIESPTDRAVQLRAGSDDGYKLYLNHELLGGLSLARAAKRDQNIHPARLHKGLNLVLLKITERTGGHAFCLRITDGRGKPYNDLKVVLEHPATKFAAKCKNLDAVDVVDGDGFAKIRLGRTPRFPGSLPLFVGVGFAEPRACRVEVMVADSAGRKRFSKVFNVQLQPSEAAVFRADVNIDQPGQATVTVVVKDARNETVLARLARSFEVLDVAQIEQEYRSLREKLAATRAREKQLQQKLAPLNEKIARLRKHIAGQYARIEELYARRWRLLAQRYCAKSRSIDVPFSPASSPRERVCLNGDGWQIVAATPRPGYYKIDEDRPPQAGWEPGWVPMMAVEKYFRSYFFPAQGKESPYGPTMTLPCAPKGWRLSDARLGGGIWYRTTINIPSRWRNRRVLFETEYASYRIKVYLDGRLCGTHKGWPGKISIELGNATPGPHELLVLAQRAASLGEVPRTTEQFYGLIGDVYLTAVSDVAVTDTWVLTSWRNAQIEARIWLINRGSKPRTVTVDGQVVRGGRTRLRLGSDQVTLNPGVITEVRLQHPWTTPRVWGIGGKYGAPTLYHLVTTVREGDEILDQHFTRFGFREFWKEGFHFYLNGKRVFIQGDNVGNRISSRPQQVIWQHLLRDSCNINTIRTHFEFQQGMYARVADELGMFIIPQWYPKLHVKGRGEDRKHSLSVEEFLTTPEHRENLRLYAEWVKWLRNHPSVIIYSTDNEIFTQAWDTPEKLSENIRNDRLGAVYGRWVKELDPTRLVTRDGDEGTWGKIGKWQEQPPADIANYHYPDFNVRDLVENWQWTYEKPVLFGETLYCSYGAWNGWIDAIPSQVAAKANWCRKVLSLYRDLEVSGWVGMGPGLDCFTELKEDGSGNPWGVSPTLIAKYKADGVAEELPHYPYFPIEWPTLSGPGLKPEFHRFLSVYGYGSVNTYFPTLPVYVPNAVNAAYKQSTHPMPPLPSRRPTEVLLIVTENGKPLPYAWVILTPASGQATNSIGVRADSRGRAWFVLDEAGTYKVRVEGKPRVATVKVKAIPFKMEAGFDYLPRISLEVGQ